MITCKECGSSFTAVRIAIKIKPWSGAGLPERDLYAEKGILNKMKL
jgi:hypothetical protein